MFFPLDFKACDYTKIQFQFFMVHLLDAFQGPSQGNPLVVAITTHFEKVAKLVSATREVLKDHIEHHGA